MPRMGLVGFGECLPCEHDDYGDGGEVDGT